MENDKDNIFIRLYHSGDREAIRRINYETSFVHKPRLFIEDQEIVADALTRYYTDFEPQSCFVAQAGERVVGYIIGTLNLKKMRRVYFVKIFLPLLFKAVTRKKMWRFAVWRFIWNCLRSFLKGEFNVPDFDREYPATFHINVDEGFRGKKIGYMLIVKAQEYLKENHIPAVQFSTMTDDSKKFFTGMGFKVLYSSRRSFLQYALGHDTPFYLYGMKF